MFNRFAPRRMETFLIIATAHFLALLSPGPDFFLVARTSLNRGWLIATGVCLGIALANGVFILAAFAGITALKPDSPLFFVLQLAGCGYLLYLGVLFIRHAGRRPMTAGDSGGNVDQIDWHPSAHWLKATGMGFLSGILNPKNALFYASLATLLTGGPHDTSGWKFLYGLWMFSMVLFWDLLIASLIGHPRVVKRFGALLPGLERLSGVLLILVALGVPAYRLRSA